MDTLLPVLGVLLIGLSCPGCATIGLSCPGCATDSCQTATIFGLKTADCLSLGLVDFPRTLDRDVKVLKFAENRLQFLVADQFRFYPTLQEIYLARNRISSIAAGAFRGLLNLQKLDLEANQLSHVRYDFLADARSVRVLNFRFNPIAIVEPGALSNLPNLEEISFERCRLTSIDARTFEGLDRLVSINLADNDLAELSPEMERHLPAGLRVLRFYRNPWRCDCRLRWLRIWTATRSGITGTEQDGGVSWDFSRNTPACAAPRLLRGVSWKLLDADQFACPAQIVVNSSTSVRLTPGSNTSIECVVVGDPEPTVTWYKDSMEVDGDLVEAYRDEEHTGGPLDASPSSALMRTRVYIMLNDVTIDHTGDYRCVAQNSAGRSEVTFKVWMDYEDGSGQQSRDSNGDYSAIGSRNTQRAVRLEVAVGSAIGAGFIILIAIVFGVVVCLVKRRRRFRQHSYHVRDYQVSNNNTSTTSGKNVPIGFNNGRTSKKKHVVNRESHQFLRLPSCLRTSANSELVSDKFGERGEQEADDEDTCSVEGGVGFQLLLRQSDDEEIDKFASSTLQSLIEEKETTFVNQCEDVVTIRRSSSDPPAEITKVDEVRNDDYDEPGDSIVMAASDGEGSDSRQVPLTGSAVCKANLDDDDEPRCATFITQEPDLLLDGGGPMHNGQLRSLFRSGDVSARSQFRQTRSASSGSTATKVSFAIDSYRKDEEEEVPPSEVVESSRATTLFPLDFRCRAEENEYVVRAPANDEISSSREQEDCAWPFAIHGGGSGIAIPPTSSSAATASINTSEAQSNTSGRAAQTGSFPFGRRVRPKLTNSSTSIGGGRHSALSNNYCNYTMPSARNNPRSAATHGFKSRLPPVLENSSKMAMPSAIVGVTEGLVMVPPFSRSASMITRSSSSSTFSLAPQGPRKPTRTYEWNTLNGEADLNCGAVTGDKQHGLTSVAGTASFRLPHKRAQLPLATPPLSQSQKNSFGTAV